MLGGSGCQPNMVIPAPSWLPFSWAISKSHLEIFSGSLIQITRSIPYVHYIIFSKSKHIHYHYTVCSKSIPKKLYCLFIPDPLSASAWQNVHLQFGRSYNLLAYVVSLTSLPDWENWGAAVFINPKICLSCPALNYLFLFNTVPWYLQFGKVWNLPFKRSDPASVLSPCPHYSFSAGTLINCLSSKNGNKNFYPQINATRYQISDSPPLFCSAESFSNLILLQTALLQSGYKMW